MNLRRLQVPFQNCWVDICYVSYKYNIALNYLMGHTQKIRNKKTMVVLSWMLIRATVRVFVIHSLGNVSESFVKLSD